MSPFKFLLRAVSHHPLKVSAMFIGDGLHATFLLLLPFALKDLIDKLGAYNSAADADGWAYIMPSFMWFLFIVLAAQFSIRISGIAFLMIAGVFRIKPRNEMISYLQSHSMNYFQNKHSGSLGSKINEASNGLGFALWGIIFDLWPTTIKVIVGLWLLFITSSILAMGFAVWFVTYLLFMVYFAKKMYYWSEQTSKARSNITGKVVDMATNIYAVKSYANEELEHAIIREAGDNERKTINGFQTHREIRGWIDSFMLSIILIYMGYYSIDLFLQQKMTLGDVSFVISMMMIVSMNIQQLTWGIVHFLEHVGQTRDGVKTIYDVRTVVDQEQAKDLKVQNQNAPVLFDNVGFCYPEQKDKQILENLLLDIPAGQKVGLIGQSGAGKSTLVNLMLRFYDIGQGSIKIDGQDIANVTQQSLRRNIAVIPQDTSLFHRTLLENIRYGRLDVSDEEVIEAAKKAHAHDFISELPDGYDTLVGERGVKLSGGQRQRIAIARAILKDAPILILDEATSALDSESEKLIQESLKGLMQGKTVIAIAHRLSTIAHLDRLIVMEEGKIIEDGTHDELFSQGGLYSKLWSMQSGGFLKEN